MSIRSQAARRSRSAVLTVSVAFSAACIGADGRAANDAPSNGGYAGTLSGGAAAAAGTGGGSMASGGVGGWGAGGVGGAGGIGGTMMDAGSGGAGGSEMMPSGGQSGGGGTGSGGTAGSSPIVDAGEPPSEATPSAGCNGTAARPAGGVVTVAQSHYLAFPESYDGTTPYPVLVGFHGCGGVNRGTSAGDTEWMRLTDDSSFATEYVRVVPLSADGGGCWSYGTDIARIKQIHDDLLAVTVSTRAGSLRRGIAQGRK